MKSKAGASGISGPLSFYALKIAIKETINDCLLQFWYNWNSELYVLKHMAIPEKLQDQGDRNGRPDISKKIDIQT